MSKILIVEDDIYLLKLYGEVFTKEGYQVELAEDGKQGIEKAQLFEPEIMLLDLMLPYIDGFGVLEAVKGNPKTKNIKVVIITNLDSTMQRQKALSMGAAEFLVKSSDTPGKIVDEVKATLSKLIY